MNPTAKPETGGLAEYSMRISPGVTGSGTTANPTAKPAAQGLAEKAMQDHPGVNANAQILPSGGALSLCCRALSARVPDFSWGSGGEDPADGLRP